jgi:DNA polymerase
MTEEIDRTRTLAALRLMMEWGADEALADAPIDRFISQGELAVRVAPRPALVDPPPTATPAAAATPSQQAERVAAAADSIAALREALAGFTGCGLRATAGSLVFADGNPDAGLVLIGEAPGAEEDRAGRPFVGASGRLLDQMLGSIGLDRTQCLITNIIPWRPPGNRNPTDNEILVCLPFLHRHLALLRPRRVVLLGAMAARALTGSGEGIRKLRGRWVEITIPGLARPIPALPMLHPAYLLRQPGAKREAWADLIALKRAIESQS